MSPNFHLKNKRSFCSLTRYKPIVNVIKIVLNDGMGLQLTGGKGIGHLKVQLQSLCLAAKSLSEKRFAF